MENNKVTIENLTPSELEFLKEFINNLKTQNNGFTSSPIYSIEKKVKVRGEDNVEYVEKYSGDYCSYESFEELVIDYKEYHGISEDEEIYLSEYEDYFIEKFNYDWEIVHFTFTEENANIFINRNGHNYPELRIYIISAYRNYELLMLLDIFNKINI